MQGQRWSVAAPSVMIALASAALIWAAQLPMEPTHESGQNITPAYEGWYPNDDGTFNLLIGYYNRNTKQVIDIPVGPNNHMDPGGPDMGQPTHFLPGRQWGVFLVKVPKDFGTKKITWTINANGKPATVPFHMDPVYVVAPFKDAQDNTPPFIAFSDAGPFTQGPPTKIHQTLTANAGEPLALSVWVADDAKVPPAAQFGGAGRFGGRNALPVSVTWLKFRGPGEVKFDKNKPQVEKVEFKAPPPAVFTGKASTTAIFADPGDYLLEVVANDISGDGGRGFQCCWTTAQVKVTVKAAAGSK
ncbi:MAG TPA: hypothetical protein VEV17_13915 [Bryobacteraceae bacterium]|nr:hypothetical protein [Bryobacteraceae bacterium]